MLVFLDGFVASLQIVVGAGVAKQLLSILSMDCRSRCYAVTAQLSRSSFSGCFDGCKGLQIQQSGKFTIEVNADSQSIAIINQHGLIIVLNYRIKKVSQTMMSKAR